MADILPIPTFDEQIKSFRAVEREIGASEFKLELIDFLQSKGYNALVLQDVITFVPKRKA